MLNEIGSVCSIVGFVVTMYVAATVRKVERSYVKQAMIDTCLPNLKAAQKNIRSGINKSDEARIRQELQKCLAVLKQVLHHSLNRTETQTAINVIARVAQLRGNKILSEVDGALEVIAGEATRLELARTQVQWSRKNG